MLRCRVHRSILPGPARTRAGARAPPAEHAPLNRRTASVSPSSLAASAFGALRRWLDRNVLELGRELRLSYLPPLMVYLAAGVSGLTEIVGTFFVKERLGLSAEFLAALGFWAGIPWALKMPLGHLVDLTWRWKGALVFVGACLIALSLAILIGLLGYTESLLAVWPAESWFVASSLLAPIGYVVQDVVADAMTVEAIPQVDERGEPIPEARTKLMHTSMQTLGRVAIIGSGAVVAALNLWMFRDIEAMPAADQASVYQDIYTTALCIPVLSVLGVALAALLRARDRRRLRRQGLSAAEVRAALVAPWSPPAPNGWILGGGLLFVGFTVGTGLSDFPYNQEAIFAGSMAIVLFLLLRLTRTLDSNARRHLVGTACVIFVFRAVPTPGAGQTWWMIDVLGFDQYFLSLLSLLGNVLTLAGLFVFRRFMAERSIAYVVVSLTVADTLLVLPMAGMYYGLHEWTAAHTGGIVDARFIALTNTALESPLGQIAMVPMLAWIASSAPPQLKATYFAVMASFTNLALSLSRLGTKYLNQVFTVTREVQDPASGAIRTPADYSELGTLLIVTAVIGLVLPLATVWAMRALRLRTA